MKRVALPLLLLLPLTACGAADEQTLTVLAASSLTGVLQDLEKEFEEAHPGVDVRLVLGSSATLVEQVRQGAPADVLVTADQPTMDRAERAGLLRTHPRVFASNVLVVAVPRNGAKVHRVRDLESARVRYVACVPTAPCGTSVAPLLRSAKVTRRPVSEEPDARATLARLLSGDVDAAIVYRTDVKAEEDSLAFVTLPGAARTPNSYWVAGTRSSSNDALTTDWIRDLTSADDLLRDAGFLLP